MPVFVHFGNRILQFLCWLFVVFVRPRHCFNVTFPKILILSMNNSSLFSYFCRKCLIGKKRGRSLFFHRPSGPYIISTVTLSPFLIAAALTTVRIALAMRPCLPMTLPISSCATLKRMTVSPSSTAEFTCTLSG